MTSAEGWRERADAHRRPDALDRPRGEWDRAEVTGIIRRVAVIDKRFLWQLVLLALITRMIWVLWVHPPDDYVFSDMKKYVDRAQDLVLHGFRPGVRTLAWQVWGTHYLIALPLVLFKSLRAASILWGLMGAAAVPATYLLACRVATRRWIPKVAAIVMLCWYPNLSNSGYFLSETPFLCFQVWSTYLLVVVLQDGRMSWAAGIFSALAFAVRPQAALFFLLVLLTWALNRKRLHHVLPKHLFAVAVPLLLTLAFSMYRFHSHTGYWTGIAENANMNLTAGRCHNIVTQAFNTQAELDHAEQTGNTRSGRRISLPAFRALAHHVDKQWPDSPFGLRPAFGSETIRFVGYIGDPEIHAEIRAQCYARTGPLEQVRYSVVNTALLYFVGLQWPESERGARYFAPGSIVYKHIYQVGILIPSLVGMVAALLWIRRRSALTFCAWQLLVSMGVAAVIFGTIRLRTPYDPYAVILALEGWVLLVPWVRRRLSSKVARRELPPDDSDVAEE